jgi:hypothetical protein
VNGLLVSVAGLIAVAVGNELVIAHPHDQTSVALSLVLFGGPLLYLLSQTVYLWQSLTRGRGPGWPASPRWRWPEAYPTPPCLPSPGAVATVLLVLIVTVVRERDATASRRLTHRPGLTADTRSMNWART